MFAYFTNVDDGFCLSSFLFFLLDVHIFREPCDKKYEHGPFFPKNEKMFTFFPLFVFVRYFSRETDLEFRACR